MTSLYGIPQPGSRGYGYRSGGSYGHGSWDRGNDRRDDHGRDNDHDRGRDNDRDRGRDWSRNDNDTRRTGPGGVRAYGELRGGRPGS